MKRLIGYGYTNNKGIATLDYDKNGQAISPSGYGGNSRGLVDIQAVWHEDETIESEQIEITDCLFFDSGTTGTVDSRWKINGGTGNRTSNENGTKFENVNSDIRFDNFIKNDNGNIYIWNAPFCIEVDIIAITGTPRLQIWSSSTGEALNTCGTVGHWTVKYDGTTISTQLQGANPYYYTRSLPNARIGFYCSKTHSITFKNLEIYPYPRTTSPNEVNLISSKNPVKTDETYQLKAFLKGIDGVGSFYPVDFYRGNTKFKTVITDRSGCATVNDLIGTGNGLISYKAKYNDFESTITEYDYIKYDNGTLNSHNDIWAKSSTNPTITRQSEYTDVTESNVSDWGAILTEIKSNTIVEFDVMQIDGALSSFCWELSKLQNSGYINGMGLSYVPNGALNTWYHLELQITPTKCMCYYNGNNVREFTYEELDTLWFGFWLSREISKLRFKNFKVYKI